MYDEGASMELYDQLFLLVDIYHFIQIF